MMTEVVGQGAALIAASENFLFHCNCSLVTIENNVLTLTLLVLNFYWLSYPIQALPICSSLCSAVAHQK